MERRAHARFVLELPVEIELSGSDHLLSRGHTLDVSEGGVRVRLGSPLPGGGAGQIAIAAPDQSFVLGAVAIEAPTPEDEAAGVRRLRLIDLTTANLERLLRLLADPLELTWTTNLAEELPCA